MLNRKHVVNADLFHVRIYMLIFNEQKHHLMLMHHEITVFIIYYKIFFISSLGEDIEHVIISRQ